MGLMDITESQYGELVEAEENRSIERTDQQKDQEFINAYMQLCEQYKRTLSAAPSWRHSLDGNDYRLTFNFTVTRKE